MRPYSFSVWFGALCGMSKFEKVMGLCTVQYKVNASILFENSWKIHTNIKLAPLKVKTFQVFGNSLVLYFCLCHPYTHIQSTNSMINQSSILWILVGMNYMVRSWLAHPVHTHVLAYWGSVPQTFKTATHFWGHKMLCTGVIKAVGQTVHLKEFSVLEIKRTQWVQIQSHM